MLPAAPVADAEDDALVDPVGVEVAEALTLAEVPATAPVTLPAGDPAVLLGLKSLMHEDDPAPITRSPTLPPVPFPRLSPTKSWTEVPARALTVHAYEFEFG